MKKNPNKEPKPQRPQPRPTEIAVFNDSKWFAWRIDNEIKLFRRRSFYEKDADGHQGCLCIDFEPLGIINNINKPDAMPLDKWADLKGAVDYCTRGIV